MRVVAEQYLIPPEYHEFLMPFVQGVIPSTSEPRVTTFGSSGTQTIETLELETAAGHFRSSRAMVSNSHFELIGNRSQNDWVEIIPNDLEFTVAENISEEIWFLPLFGNLSEFRPCTNAYLITDRSPYIHFEADGYNCGLLVFGQADDSISTGFTAAVFGTIGDRPRRKRR